MPLNVAMYLRVSTGRQAEQDLSIPDQRRQVTTYCATKGWNVVSEFVEPGASAMDDRRPEFQRMMDAACSKPSPFDIIVVHSFSRFFRDHFALEFNVRRLAKNGVRLASITQELGDDPTHVMMRQIMALFDEYQSRENAKHTLRAMKENARQGFWNGTRPPYGYRIVEAERRGSKTKKKLEIDPLQADIVRRMYDMVLNGDEERRGMGAKAIADKLNREGFSTRSGAKWSQGGVHKMLQMRSYMGKHQFNRTEYKTGRKKPESEIVDVAIPAIISEDTFRRAQEVFRARRPSITPSAWVVGRNLLSGLAYCMECGGSIRIRTAKNNQYRYYTCCTAVRKGLTACPGVSHRLEVIDEAIVANLEEWLLTSERLRGALAGLVDRREAGKEQRQEKIADLRRQAAEADAKLARLYNAIEEGLVDLADAGLKGRVAELRMARDRARAAASHAAEAEAAVTSANLSDAALEKFARTARRKLRIVDGRYRADYLRAMVQRVELGRRHIRLIGRRTTLLSATVNGPAKACGAVHSAIPEWRPQGDLNPCSRRERAMSWATRRWGRGRTSPVV